MNCRTRNSHHNSTYTQVGVQCFYESEVLNQSSVLLMKFSVKNPHLRVAAKRYGQVYKTLQRKWATSSVFFSTIFESYY